MRPTPITTVARYLLLDRITYLVLPWGWAAFGFALDVLILQLTPAGHSGHRWVGGLAAVFIVVFVLGVQSVARALPFALTLGVSRHTYFLGATTLAGGLAITFGLAVTLGQSIERATDGWGMRMAYFRVPHLLDGSWYLSWLTASVAFTLMFAYGMWYGLIYRRSGAIGTVIFGGAQLTTGALAAVVTTWAHDWSRLGHFITTINTIGITAVLAAATIIILTGGLATIRRLNI